MHTTLLAAALLAVLAYASWKYFLSDLILPSPLDDLPAPPSLSFIKGNVPDVTSRQSWRYWRQHAKTYGPVSVLHGLLGTKILVVFDPRALHSILLKDAENFPQRLSPSDDLNMLLGPGLLTSEGSQHRRQRKLLNPVFSAAHLRHMTDMFYEISHKLCAAIGDRVAKEAAVVDMNGWMARVTLEILGQAGFGYSFDNFMEDSTDAYGDSIKNFFPVFSRLPLLPIVLPWMTYLAPDHLIKDILRLLPHAGLRRMMDISDTMERRSQEIIAEKKAALTKGDQTVVDQVGERKDIMSILLKANMIALDQDKLTDTELCAQMSTFILAGMDTTSNALSRTLQVLAQHPEAQKKLRAEIIEAHNGEMRMDYDALCKLPYLDAVIRETLRLYAPVALLPRRPTKDAVLPLSAPIRGKDGALLREVLVPKGTRIVVNLQASNVNEAYWGEDAYEWRPERWLEPLPEALEEARIPGIYSHLMSFMGGSRACIGFKFAQLEMKVVLSVLLMAFSFELTGKEITWNSGPVSYPTMGWKNMKPEMLLRMKAL
ncbi:cytochrome P450 [Dichomitus squalens]|uniref:Cytochrome P450 n=1 Tax=Dichomitus squalens TaxID=114155 RepID=A0A4Q9MSQ6_9APHY|nr:cytochrome P450 [Dichomitus squalens]